MDKIQAVAKFTDPPTLKHSNYVSSKYVFTMGRRTSLHTTKQDAQLLLLSQPCTSVFNITVAQSSCTCRLSVIIEVEIYSSMCDPYDWDAVGYWKNANDYVS